MNEYMPEPFGEKPPERIFGWLNTLLAIARHFGGITYNGHAYSIAYNEEGQPLVRFDVLKREAKEARKARADARKAAKAGHGDLL
jgi:hypothetical protein